MANFTSKQINDSYEMSINVLMEERSKHAIEIERLDAAIALLRQKLMEHRTKSLTAAMENSVR